MDDPVKDIPGVVHKLTQGQPSEQQTALETYFTQNAAFTHPFVRVPRFQGSRTLVHGIFRWYKIMSPRIDISVNGVAFDKSNLTLYVDITQDFRIFLVPFYKAPVHLVTVLSLEYDKAEEKYYIGSQNDLYQTDQFVRFIAPGFGAILVAIWQLIAAIVCFVMAKLFWPITYIEENYKPEGWYGLALR